jgi:hypothetical protein
MLFGVLIFVFGVLLLFNAWAVVDAKMGATSAARESVREYVESSGDLALALDSGRRAFESSTGLDPTAIDFTVEGVFERCSRVTVTASYQVPAIRLPFGGWGNGFNVAASHSEIVDPFRSGLEGAARCR